MAGMRCCDGGDLVIPRAHRLQGTASELLAGQKKEKTLWELDESLADVAETPIPWTGSLQCPWVVSCRDSGCPSSWDEWLGGAARKGLAGHSCCSSSGSSLLLSCEMFCWSCPGVVLWEGAVCALCYQLW